MPTSPNGVEETAARRANTRFSRLEDVPIRLTEEQRQTRQRQGHAGRRLQRRTPRPDMAQAGGKNADNPPEAFDTAKRAVEEMLSP